MTNRTFEQANDESRERLARLVKTLIPGRLGTDLGEGWTVASALAHMGFWDRWQAERWTRMLGGEWEAQDESISAAEHLANEALHPYWAGIAAEDVPALALEAATKLDALIASAPKALIDDVLAGPSAYLVNRFRHRGDHLDHIERTLKAAAGEAGDRSFVERNAASRRRLLSLVEGLRASDMALPTEEGGWTIAQVLGHLAFWDRSMEVRWRQAAAEAGEGGRLEPVSIPNGMTDAINLPLAGLLSSWTALLGTHVAAEALAAAESLDCLLAELADRLPADSATQKPQLVNRWMHREAHLSAIEAAIAVRSGQPSSR